MGVKALLLDEKDTVATCMDGAGEGDVVTCIGTAPRQVLCVQAIPPCHKIALKDMQENEDVYKYGQVIGRTTQVIREGALVWHENLVGFERDYETELL